MTNNRSQKGGMLVLIIAIILGIVMAILLFTLGYMRIIGSNAEQKTAIEAAALAAAREISSIVINTPEFGYIGLSDSAPNGTSTTAGDTFYTPVHSINTLIGTARLNMIIASQLGIPEMEELAINDLIAARTRADELITVLDAAITTGGNGNDKHGGLLTPYIAAETAYQQNQIRMTGSSNYVLGSLQLTLGAIEGGSATNIPIPNPPGVDASLNTSNTVGGHYKSYVNMPFNGQDFVFAGIGDSVKLVDHKKWTTKPSATPYFHRTIVRAEAQQQVDDAGLQKSATILAAACAQPASVYDPKPAPGALTISFPDGMPDGTQQLTMPLDLYGPYLADASDLYTAATGDYPVDTGSTIATDTNWPITSDAQYLASNACIIAVYDWLKRAGTKADVNSVVGMHNTPFDAQGPDVPFGPGGILGNVPAGIVHIYRFDTDGLVSYQSKDQAPKPWYVVGHNQAFIESFDVLNDGAIPFTVSPISLPSSFLNWPIATTNATLEFTEKYDLYVRSYSRRMSTINGGKHAGEPMDNTVVARRPGMINLSSSVPGRAIFENTITGRGAQGKKWWKKGQTGFNGAPPGLSSREDFP
ncbi:MAG: hypothetical protein K8F91_16135, partial [Candidatus Obscuribacterales bacterium]|nr:hypothetical protein [Candidatus Obscuribacterales bacterium]